MRCFAGRRRKRDAAEIAAQMVEGRREARKAWTSRCAFSLAQSRQSAPAVLPSAVNSGNLRLTEASIWRASKPNKAGRRYGGPARRIPRRPGSEDMRRIAVSFIAAVARAATATCDGALV
jgi:hypothetical protein